MEARAVRAYSSMEMIESMVVEILELKRARSLCR